VQGKKRDGNPLFRLRKGRDREKGGGVREEGITDVLVTW
jgi:hypothetical protein